MFLQFIGVSIDYRCNCKIAGLAEYQKMCAIVSSGSFPSLDNIQVMMIFWRLRGNIIRTVLCWIV